MGMEVLDRDTRMWGMFCHLSALIGYFVIPVLGNLAGPAIIWLIKREESSFVDDQGKESLNFQISVMVYSLIAGILTFILLISIIGIPFVLLFVILGPLVWLAVIILIIYAALQANQGIPYRYPFTIRFIQ